VQRLLARMEQDCAKPITLRQLAGELGLNAAYVSGLFSRAVGLPFKALLTERRLQQAKARLGEPNLKVCDVAYAVGYTSENRFRAAFKKATGLAPEVWRETMRMNPPPGPSSP
jgi:two-component system response regulator YesN